MMTEDAQTVATAEKIDKSQAENLASQINGRLGGWAAAMRLHFLHASGDEVTAELQVGPEHLQAYGIVHGGVYAGVI